MSLRLTIRRSTARSAGLIGGALVALVAGATVTVGAESYQPAVLYTESNAAAAQGGNAILAFRAQSDDVIPFASFATGGAGTGTALGSQGALALAASGQRLVAVNAGTDTVSAFAVESDGNLRLLDTAPSGGTDPISVTVWGQLVEVLNAGSSTVSGLWLGAGGLHPLTMAAATASLSVGASSPEQVSFTPDGSRLVVTEKGSSTIDTFSVGAGGSLGSAVTTPATGAAPYGFGFDRSGDLVVSDAAGGPDGTSAVTTYRIEKGGMLDWISDVADGQDAACWLIVNPSGNRAYTANAASGTISSYDVGAFGHLTLRASVAATTGGHPVDLAISGSTLYDLVSPQGEIATAPILPGGDLGTATHPVTGLPASATGLVAATP
ncbi:MAG: beta-propeller fold lactonase family protein [Candidatus Dormibacteria bacterium]|jgi:6-phosphogluconolactonase (cycloisomerase 2 family)